MSMDKATADALEHLKETCADCPSDRMVAGYYSDDDHRVGLCPSCVEKRVWKVAHLAKVIADLFLLHKQSDQIIEQRCLEVLQLQAKIEALTKENTDNTAAYLAALTDRQRLMDERLVLVKSLTEENDRLNTILALSETADLPGLRADNARLRAAIEGMEEWKMIQPSYMGDIENRLISKHNAEVRRLKSVLESNVRVEVNTEVKKESE